MSDRAAPLSPVSSAALFPSHRAVIASAVAFVCARHHLAPTDAEDFSSHVILKIVEDDYAILRKFQGRSSPRTYLTVVIERLFLDYRISAWGKWRPSAEAKRLGEVAMLIERSVTRDGHTFEETCELLRSKHGITATRAELEALAGRLPARTRRRFESDDVLESVPGVGTPVDELLLEGERAATALRVESALKTAMAPLPTQDRLILALRFEDGRTVADIARMLHVDQKELYRRIERLLKDLRRVLQEQGIESSAVMEMFESPAVSIEWRDVTGQETSQPRPSTNKGADGWR